MSARYSVGIDLGTTHCVLAYVALDEDGKPADPASLLAIPQLTGLGQIESKAALPSFCYLPTSPTEHELLALPWATPDHALGYYAREQSGKQPNSVISSAKSWLGVSEQDRRAEFLPIEAAADAPKRSPYAVTVALLTHLKQAWQQQFPDAPLAEQWLTITVPASFEPGARDLTAAAAAEVGLGHAVLLEEPQAALYAWIDSHQHDWREQLTVGDVLLVVDIGGGTTDLSLIAVGEQDGALSLERVAVGDHLLLGGDNMDLALANVVRQKVAQQGQTLQTWQFLALAHGCREAKESLFNNPELTAVPVVVPGRGSSLIGGTLRSELTRDEVTAVLVEGFFPATAINDLPVSRPRAALAKLSLPYAQDPAITRHLAAFLTKHAQADNFIKPTALLFNGGVVKAEPLTSRIGATLNRWLSESGSPEVAVLSGTHPDHAVAKGAAYFGAAKRSDGVRIRGGLGCSYYVGIESSLPAIPGFEPPIEAFCIAPHGLEEGNEIELPMQQFALVVGEQVQFRLFASNTRHDGAGTVLPSWSEGELEELAPISVTLSSDKRQPGSLVPVLLHAHVDELGKLSLFALPVEGDEQWQISFDTRAA